MENQLSIEELSAWTGEPPERLRHWRSLGLIGNQEDEGFAPEDAERVRLIQASLQRGVRLETIARMAGQSGGLLWIPYLDAARTGAKRFSLTEAATQVGIDQSLLERLWQATGLAEPRDMLDEADLDAVRNLKLALDAGFPEEAIMQIARVYGDTFARMAEAEVRLFHFYVQDRLRQAGLSEPELARTAQEASARLYELVEPMLLYFHRRGLVRAAREDTVTNLAAEESGSLDTGEVPGRLRLAVVFVDISSFTPMTEAMGDLTATQILAQLSVVVRETVNRWQGRLVKQMGDGFMLVFPDARSAVACALEIDRGAAGKSQFPAVRSGIHWGQALYRDGDYFGASINIASRVAAEAARHQVLVTAAARREASSLEGVEFVPLGKRPLKGVADDLELFEAHSTHGDEKTKAVDPVCGMELAPSEVAASLLLEGRQLAFCSEECLRRFIEAPGRYKGSA